MSHPRARSAAADLARLRRYIVAVERGDRPPPDTVPPAATGTAARARVAAPRSGPADPLAPEDWTGDGWAQDATAEDDWADDSGAHETAAQDIGAQDTRAQDIQAQHTEANPTSASATWAADAGIPDDAALAVRDPARGAPAAPAHDIHGATALSAPSHPAGGAPLRLRPATALGSVAPHPSAGPDGMARPGGAPARHPALPADGHAGRRPAASEPGEAAAQPAGAPAADRPDSPALPSGLHRLRLGPPLLDAALGGGLALGALHEATAGAPGQEGALLAFGLALAAAAARATGRPVLLVQQELALLEAGELYGPGLAAWGLPAEAVLLVRVRQMQDLLFVMEEGLKCTGLSAVLGECAAAVPEALTATRRLSLAARAGRTLGLLLRQRPDPAPCAAFTRWRVASAPSAADDAYGGFGPPRLDATLTRNRAGPAGRFLLSLAPDGLRQHAFPADAAFPDAAHEDAVHDIAG